MPVVPAGILLAHEFPKAGFSRANKYCITKNNDWDKMVQQEMRRALPAFKNRHVQALLAHMFEKATSLAEEGGPWKGEMSKYSPS
jgi:hypothetical protein